MTTATLKTPRLLAKTATLAFLLSAVAQAATTYTFTTVSGVAGWGALDGRSSSARFGAPGGITLDRRGVLYVADTGNYVIRSISTDGIVSTLAGTAGMSGNIDATGPAARFTNPKGVAIDQGGNLYVADSSLGGVRKVTPEGVVTTIATLASPAGVAIDSTGNVYVTESVGHTVRKITPAGVITVVAGVPGVSGRADGSASQACLDTPEGVAVDGVGNLYVTEPLYYTVRKITPDGNVTTFAGSSGFFGHVDAVGSAARFARPVGIAVDGAGNVFVADDGNNAIRKVTPAGVVSTWAGSPTSVSGATDGTGTSARFFAPQGVVATTTGELFVTDGNNHAIRKISSTRVVTTIAGQLGGANTVNGTRTTARFAGPNSVAVEQSGIIYVADETGNTIRKIAVDGTVTTLAGTPNSPGSQNGTGPAARFNRPEGVCVDSTGTIYVADQNNHTIRKITPAGAVTTFAGLAGSFGSTDATGSAARFNQPSHVAADTAGNIYVADYGNNLIRRITPAGAVTTLAGTAGQRGSSDGTGAAARFYAPYGVALDSSNYIYVADAYNNIIRKISPAGVVTTLAGLAQFDFFGFPIPGNADGTGSAARFNTPNCVAVDSSDNVFVADAGNHTIRKITPAAVVTTIGGTPGVLGADGGTGAAARFFNPYGVATDTLGNVYVADFTNNSIRKGVPTAALPEIILNSTASRTNAIGFGMTGAHGLTIVLESATDFSNWSPVGNFPLDGGSNSCSMPFHSEAKQFYRAKVR